MYGNRRVHNFCMETDNMEKEGSLSMEIEGIPIQRAVASLQ